MAKKTPADFRKHSTDYFFSRGSMHFFGDTMRSYGSTRFNGEWVLYRKRTALVNVCGGDFTPAGTKFFNGWKQSVDGKMCPLCKADQKVLYKKLYESQTKTTKPQT